ncbi:MAG TPA: hypothetical protein VFZ65_16400 [Planctomycetota bacterium]|nr:hypothetical protein [Planctomycetota bacterium]
MQSALRLLAPLAILFGLTSVSFGQQAAAAVRAAWQTFQQEAPGHWIVEWQAATGTPRAIYGEGRALADWRGNSLEEARRQANAALQRWPDLLGLGASDLHETIGARMGRTWSFTFEQSFRGVPVLDGRVDVRIHMRGRLCYLGSTVWPVPATFDTTPAIGAENAIALAWLSLGTEPNHVAQPGRARQPRLVIWGDAAAPAPAPIHLAWEVPVSAVDENGQGPVGRVYIDARTGRRLHWVSDKHECGVPGCAGRCVPTPATYTVMAYLHSALSPASTPTNEPLVGVEVDVPGMGTFVTDANGQFSVDLTSPTTVTVDLDGVHNRLVQGPGAPVATLLLQPGVGQTFQLGAPGSSANELAHTTTYYWVHRVNEFARSILGNTPQLTIADQVQPTVNITATCNAFYAGNSINFYSAGGGCNNTAGASVVAHEWGHGLDDRYGGISQAHGLSEGWGDICSMYLLDDPVIGHDFFAGGGGIRNGNNNRQYPTGSEVHEQGESWMGFAWLFRQNLRATVGNAQAIAISNDVVIGSIVANASDQPAAVLQVFLADDDDGNLVNGTPHHAELAAACQAHSLPYPPILPGYLNQANPLTTTMNQLVPRLVECDAVPSFGTFTQVRVHYDDGALHQRDMIPTGTPNRYRAMLPGMLSPQILRYHFEAVHSGGTTFRLPETGEYAYSTLAQQTIWREDFESGAPGWTHGASAGTDDWEIDVPAGYGNALWTDPAAAASGSRCAGTDLTGDGAYSASSDSWLRSPPIDCTGRSNVHLRFQRWLSCDVGFQDRMELRVNGMLLWVNPQTLLQQTAWSTFDVSVAIAANNPSVVVEFVLQSNATSQFGGWNIDDVELYSAAATVPLTNTLSLAPEQAQQGSPLSLSVHTAPTQVFLFVIGDSPGPTVVPGIPPILVGGNFATFFDVTDAAGSWTLGFQAPASVPLTGALWYSQALTITAGLQFATSNQCVNLVTQ